MLTILLGLAGSGKTEAVCREIRDLMPGRENMVLLTPEQQSHRAERTLAKICGPALSLHAEVLSFTRMYNRAALALGGLADPLPDAGGRLLLMALAVSELGEKLRRFGGRDRRADFLPRLMATAEEFRASLLRPELLESAAEQAGGSTGEKLRELASVLEAWEAVTARQLGDSRDAVSRLADGVEKTDVGAGGVWVDGFTDFTAAELRVLEALLRRGTDLTVTLTLGEGEEERFRVQEATFRTLCQLAERRGAELKVRRLPDPARTPIRHLAENLYTYHAQPIADGAGAAEICRMPSFAEECRWAASRILGMMREDPTLRFGDFAAALPDAAEKRSTAEAVFREYGIPVFVEETESILDKGLTVSILSALTAVTEGWRFRDVFRCLKTGFGGLSPEETDELENYCLTWDIRGESAWRREADWDLRPGGYGTADERDREALVRLNALCRRVAGPLGALADALREPKPCREQLRAVWAYLSEIGAAETLRQEAEELEAGGDRALASADARLWAALMDAFSQMETVIGGVTLDASEFRRLTELLLGQRKVGAIPAALDSVSMGSPARLRGKKMRVLLVLGADDESLPARPGAAGLFSAEEKRSLFDLGLPLMHDRDEDVCRPLFELYSLAASPSEKLLMSYTGSEESRASVLVRRAESLLGVKPTGADELMGEHLLPVRETCLRLAFREDGPWSASARQALEADTLEELRQRAAQKRGSLRPETVTALYGETFRLTASRAETYHKCAYLYFLEYGLKAEERKFAGFAAPETGTFIHYLLENVCRAVKEAGGFGAVTEEKLRALTQTYCEAFAAEFFRPGQLEDARFGYLFRRLCHTAETIVLDVAAELSAGEFQPLAFELQFGMEGADSLPPVQVDDVILRGTADRVDGWTDGETLYLCVADYKTGKKEFSLTDVQYGVSIQMLLYLFMLEEHGEARFGQKVAPAGVLYSPARDALVSDQPRSADPEKLAQERAKLLRRSGILLDDLRVLDAREHTRPARYIPVKFGKDGLPTENVASAARLGDLAAYVKKLLRKMSASLRRGNVAAEPLFQAPTPEKGPCKWCPYGSVCNYDLEREPLRLKTKVEPEAFWQALEEERDHG